ncbi:MAG: DNA topoisomerase III [Bacteroidales bacterium]|nr:DNA topoisomerase III [Bacteroidales bacterium]
MIVCIAEKPSVAREIAKVLGATASHEGYIEGNGYQVTWTYGHLCTLKEPQDYCEQWRRWSVSALPMIPPRFGIKLIDNDGYKKQFAVIERLMQAADGIINCGDAGQEGELIQRWVMQKAGAKCPVQRLWVSSLTEEAIREAFANLKPQDEYQSLYEAGLCRAIGDWLLGMNATRLYTIRFAQAKGQVLSIGRVQTPTLAMIVKRHFEIKDFKPEKYWILSTVYRNVVFTSTKGKIKKPEEGQTALEAIKQADFEVTDIQQKAGTEAPPRLFDLTSLQVECNKKYSFSADDTLKHIQSLYEKKLTTYPRVDTTYLSDDVYAKCPRILQGITPYAPLIQPLMGKKLKKSKKVFDSSKVTDHHAIIPTGTDPQTVSLTMDEKRVYDLVARRFIAVFYPDCKFSTTTVLGAVKNEELKVKSDADAEKELITHNSELITEFKATGKQILEEGWRTVFGGRGTTPDEEGKKGDEEEQVLPKFDKGEHGPHEPQLAEKQTTPPKPYTEATLLRAMETAGKTVENEELRDALKANGIGRPSTRAAIIETLYKRQYISKIRKSLEPTPTGIALIGVIQEELLKSAELTGQWEKKLRDIEAHKYSAPQFIEELKQMTAQVVQDVLADGTRRMQY